MPIIYNRQSATEELRLVKHSGQVFTPSFLVATILDYAGYAGEGILRKHAIDNSCGDGAFLCEMANRYCKAYTQYHASHEGLREELEAYLHGIELDPVAHANCLYNLDGVAESYGLADVRWEVVHGDALTDSRFTGWMDFVLGNPPYVRVHNLDEDYASVKRFAFAQGGMTDLYLVFYEQGLRMLGPTGRLCYITPSSWLASLAAQPMRAHIMRHRELVGLIDLGHFQAFPNATTYTLIALLDRLHRKNRIDFHRFNPPTLTPEYVDSFSYEEMEIAGSFYLASRAELAMLRAIMTSPTRPYVRVKNGFATLADSVFIRDEPFEAHDIPVLKASTGQWRHALYPYDAEGKPLSRQHLFATPSVAAHLEKHREALLKGATEAQRPEWYLYGRSQALRDVHVPKYAINTIIRDLASIKLTEVPAGSGLYSGLYILTEAPFPLLRDALLCDAFIAYLSLLKNYKSGGYYTYNARDLERYLNYKLGCLGGK